MDTLEILKECNALLEGHFLLSSGKHSNRYCQCAKLLQYPDKAEKVISIVKNKVSSLDLDVIAGPAMGGITAAYELARQLGIKAIFTERENNVMTLRRGFEIKAGDRILIMEDVVTTGKSSMETAGVLESLGGIVVGIGCIVDRKVSEIPLPLYSAADLYFDTYDEEACPMCREGSKPVSYLFILGSSSPINLSRPGFSSPMLFISPIGVSQSLIPLFPLFGFKVRPLLQIPPRIDKS
jgi:orotate phosphoribosyltransferase